MLHSTLEVNSMNCESRDPKLTPTYNRNNVKNIDTHAADVAV